MTGNIEKYIAEQPINNGGNPGKGLGGQTDQLYQLVVPFGILRQVNGCTDANGYRHQEGEQRHADGVDQGRHHRLVLGGVFPGKQVPA